MLKPLSFITDDDPKHMTYGRRLALYLMKRYKWYNPQLQNKTSLSTSNNTSNSTTKEKKIPILTSTADDEEPSSPPPCLEKAWAYFEHVTLPRHYDIKITSNPDEKRYSLGKLERASSGETYYSTKLYSVWHTPLDQMGDFGIGVGLYFSALMSIIILTFVGGLVNIVNILYFASDEYSNNGQQSQDDDDTSLLGLLKRGSAICSAQVWYPCPDCSENDFDPMSGRIGISSSDGSELIFAKKNECDGAVLNVGMINWGTLLLIFGGIYAMNAYQKKMQVMFDEDEQTAQDYSILISNPPMDAKDPKEWKNFFETNWDDVHVTFCTVNVSNHLLVTSLVKRRKLSQALKLALPPGINMMDRKEVENAVEKIANKRSSISKLLNRMVNLIIPLGAPELYKRMTILNDLIKKLSTENYPVKDILLTLETESAQRRILHSLSTGMISIWTNNTKLSSPSIPKKHLFRSKHLLHVTEPEEPDTVRWEDINVDFFSWLKPIIFTSIMNGAAIALVAYVVKTVSDKKPAHTAMVIAFFNCVFPFVGQALMVFERHSSESGWQTSYYWKIALFRWVNTAIVTDIITPFTSTLDKNEIIDTVFAIFLAEIITANVIQLLDVPGNFRRHVLGPRAKTQELMNLNFRGSDFHLAERYTNMTKIMFLALWYCAIYPGTLFMCSAALMTNYICDKFSIMRTWKPASMIGTAIASASRKYFFSMTLICMAVVSSYWWSGFPFDNLCLSDKYDGVAPEYYYGTFDITYNHRGELITEEEVTINEGDPAYRYCNQYLISMRKFPALPRFQPEGDEWMTDDQEKITMIYGWTSVMIIGFMFIRLAWNSCVIPIRRLFKGGYKPNGHDMNKNFSDNVNITSYIPQVRSEEFAYPLLVCNIDNISHHLMDWCDPDQPYDNYNLTKDCELLVGSDDFIKDDSRTVFSRVAHWEPTK